MGAKGELASPARWDSRARMIVPLALAIPSLVNGAGRIGDGHLLSGWLMAGSGALMVASAVGFWLARPRA